MESDGRQNGERTDRATGDSNVIRLPREWLGSSDELVPLGAEEPAEGSAATAAERAREREALAPVGVEDGLVPIEEPPAARPRPEREPDPGETEAPEPPEREQLDVLSELPPPRSAPVELRAPQPVRAADFWGEDSASVQDALEAPGPQLVSDALEQRRQTPSNGSAVSPENRATSHRQKRTRRPITLRTVLSRVRSKAVRLAAAPAAGWSAVRTHAAARLRSATRLLVSATRLLNTRVARAAIAIGVVAGGATAVAVSVRFDSAHKPQPTRLSSRVSQLAAGSPALRDARPQIRHPHVAAKPRHARAAHPRAHVTSSSVAPTVAAAPITPATPVTYVNTSTPPVSGGGGGVSGGSNSGATAHESAGSTKSGPTGPGAAFGPGHLG